MAKDKILVVEDDTDLSFIMCTQLGEMGYDSVAAFDCDNAREALAQEDFDLILLDMSLPDMSGMDFCGEIRKSVLCPIIFVSCFGDQENIVGALRLGADDYMVKPVNYSELSARIEANLRRKRQYDSMKNIESQDEIICGGFCICPHTHCIKKAGNGDREEILLSPIEYRLIITFVKHQNELLLYENLFQNIWESDDLGDVRTVMVHVSNLRKKLEKLDQHCVKTVRGAGYIFILDSEQ